jgi:hypothetical protein
MIDRFTGKNTPYTYDSLVTSPNKINLRGDSDSDVVPDHKEIKSNPFLRAAVPVTVNSETSGNLNTLHDLNDFHNFHDSEEEGNVEEEENLEDDMHEMIPNLKKNEVRGGYLRKVNAQNGKNSKTMKIQNEKENENENGDVNIANKKKHLRASSSSGEWSANYVEAEQFHSTSSPVPVVEDVKSMNESLIPIQSYLRSSSSSRARLNNSNRPLARHMSSEIFYTIVAALFAVAVFCIYRLWTTRNSNISASRKNAKLAVAVTKEMRYNKYEIVSPDSSKLEGTRRRTRTNSEVKKKSSSSTNTFLLFSPQPEQ